MKMGISEAPARVHEGGVHGGKKEYENDGETLFKIRSSQSQTGADDQKRKERDPDPRWM